MEQGNPHLLRVHWDRVSAMKKYRRKLIQVITAVLYNCNITGFFEGSINKGAAKGVCVPGLNCYSCPGAVGSCPLGSLQSALISSRYKAPYYMLGVLLLFGTLLGRVICGFLCPFGLIQELLYKIPTPKWKKSRLTAALTKIKYVILIIFVVWMSLILGAPGFCKYICPAGTLEGGIPLAAANESIRSMLGGLFTWKVAVMLAIFILCIFAYRGFCRFICPLGAFYSLFARIAVIGYSVDEHKCSHCGRCTAYCKMDVKKVGDAECIQCGECSQVCRDGAICFRIPMKKESSCIF